MDSLRSLVFVIHLASLAAAACSVLYADKVGLAWIRGTAPTISPRTLKILHDTVSVALACLIVSGLYLFWPERAYLFTQPLFYIKMLLIAALVINSLLIDNLMDLAAQHRFGSLSSKSKSALLISGGVSLACWLGTGFTALLLFGL